MYQQFVRTFDKVKQKCSLMEGPHPSPIQVVIDKNSRNRMLSLTTAYILSPNIQTELN